MANSGVELWNKAKKIIPGGNQLLSKRSDQFLPDYWPSYYKKAKGVEVWDLDNNHYIDMSIMGIGACTLGYADKDVNSVVKAAIDDGSMCTLNSFEEVELAETILNIENWADMVRYARTGGESAAIAIRIARAATGRDKIAFCGYHGWHDWYLSANLADDKLDEHLLPGLNPLGVPKSLEGTTLPFNYNKLYELENIIAEEGENIAAIIMEPVRNHEPDPSFLKGVRRIASKIGAVLIFDEISSGWRMNVGGIHTLYGVDPDIVIFGKAMGNGHPIGAVIGKEEIMEVAQDTFISSTFWTERVGFAAGLATINKMNEIQSPKHLVKTGKRITKEWKEIAFEHELKLVTMGIPPMTSCVFNYNDILSVQLQTIFTQEMLNRGYLASTHVYTSYKHTEEVVTDYMENVDVVFSILAKGLKENTLKDILKGPVASKGFKRLN
jgi:glutamate-1-semialdehyde 2,1-aminomutase